MRRSLIAGIALCALAIAVLLQIAVVFGGQPMVILNAQAVELVRISLDLIARVAWPIALVVVFTMLAPELRRKIAEGLSEVKALGVSLQFQNTARELVEIKQKVDALALTGTIEESGDTKRAEQQTFEVAGHPRTPLADVQERLASSVLPTFYREIESGLNLKGRMILLCLDTLGHFDRHLFAKATRITQAGIDDALHDLLRLGLVDPGPELTWDQNGALQLTDLGRDYVQWGKKNKLSTFTLARYELVRSGLIYPSAID